MDEMLEAYRVRYVVGDVVKFEGVGYPGPIAVRLAGLLVRGRGAMFPLEAAVKALPLLTAGGEVEELVFETTCTDPNCAECKSGPKQWVVVDIPSLRDAK